MPRGIKVIILCNLFFASMFPMFFYVFKQTNEVFPLAAVISSAITGGLVAVSIILILRLVKLLAFSRVLIYAIMLTLGVNILLLIKFMFTPFGIFTLLVNIVVVVYLIGARGYLISQAAIDYMLGHSTDANQSDSIEP